MNTPLLPSCNDIQTKRMLLHWSRRKGLLLRLLTDWELSCCRCLSFHLKEHSSRILQKLKDTKNRLVSLCSTLCSLDAGMQICLPTQAAHMRSNKGPRMHCCSFFIRLLRLPTSSLVTSCSKASVDTWCVRRALIPSLSLSLSLTRALAVTRRMKGADRRASRVMLLRRLLREKGSFTETEGERSVAGKFKILTDGRDTEEGGREPRLEVEVRGTSPSLLSTT